MNETPLKQVAAAVVSAFEERNRQCGTTAAGWLDHLRSHCDRPSYARDTLGKHIGPVIADNAVVTRETLGLIPSAAGRCGGNFALPSHTVSRDGINGLLDQFAVTLGNLGAESCMTPSEQFGAMHDTLLGATKTLTRWKGDSCS